VPLVHPSKQKTLKLNGTHQLLCWAKRDTMKKNTNLLISSRRLVQNGGSQVFFSGLPVIEIEQFKCTTFYPLYLNRKLNWKDWPTAGMSYVMSLPVLRISKYMCLVFFSFSNIFILPHTSIV
jgi:hypothetical protein